MNNKGIKLIGMDWIETSICNYAQKTDDNTHRIRIRCSEISEVIEYDKQDRCPNECHLVMKNGNIYNVQCSYDEICDLWSDILKGK